jgi:hypothetical protein
MTGPGANEPGTAEPDDGKPATRRELGQALRAARRDAGMTQARLAARIGYARSTISNAESGSMGVSRSFWEAADGGLATGGKLSAMHEIIDPRLQWPGLPPEGAGSDSCAAAAVAAVFDNVARELRSAARELRAITEKTSR